MNCKWVNGFGAVEEYFEYAEAKRGFYILKHRSYIYQLIPYESIGSDDYWVPESKYEYDLHEPWSLPGDSEFTLSAYGLPEPPGFRRPTPWYVWVLGSGAVCFVLGLIVRRRLRRGN